MGDELGVDIRQGGRRVSGRVIFTISGKTIGQCRCRR
jgi:hypothetical protein